MGFLDLFKRRPRGSLNVVLVLPESVAPGEHVSVRLHMTADGGEVAVSALRVRLYRQSMRDDVEGPDRFELEGAPVRAYVATPGLVVGVGETVEREVSLLVPEDAILPDLPSTRQLHRLEVVVEGGVEPVTLEDQIKVAGADEDDQQDDDQQDDDQNDGEPPAMTPDTHPHELGTWLSRFRTMVDALRADTRVEVLRFDTYTPVDEGRLSQWERDLGHPLSEELKIFYRQTNGLALVWRARGGLPVSDDDLARWRPRDYGQPEGHVKLLPIDLLFEKSLPHAFEDAERTITFRGVERSARELLPRTFVLDPFSFSESAVLVLGEPEGAWVLCGADHDADLESSRVVDLGSYLELVLGVLGSVGARRSWLATSWSGGAADYEDTYTPAEYWKARGLALSTPGWSTTFPDVLRVARGSPRRGWERLLEDDDTAWSHELARHEKWVARGSGSIAGWDIFDVSGLPLLIPREVKGDPKKQLVARLPADLTRAGVSFAGRRLPYLGLPGANARGLDASGADLTLGVFVGGDFDGADFAGANLSACDFSRASLRGATFHGAELGGVDFEGSDLTGADFTGSTFRLASFRGARLDGVVIDHPSPRAPARRAFSTASLHLVDMMQGAGVAFVSFGEPPQVNLGLVLDRSAANLEAFVAVMRRFALLRPAQDRRGDDEVYDYLRQHLRDDGNDGVIMPVYGTDVHRRSYASDLARATTLEIEGLRVAHRPYPHLDEGEAGPDKD